jgi:hypothetical protein
MASEMSNSKRLKRSWLGAWILALITLGIFGLSACKDSPIPSQLPSDIRPGLSLTPVLTSTLSYLAPTGQPKPTDGRLFPTFARPTPSQSAALPPESFIDPSASIPPNTLILYAGEGQEIYIQEIGSKPSRKLFGSRQRAYATFAGWAKNGCELYINLENNLQIVDMQGNTIHMILPHDTLMSLTKSVLWLDPGISPDEQWLWFYVGSGEPSNQIGEYQDYEHQDLAILPANRSHEPTILSKNGGSWTAPVWSPNGKWIAFTDLDSNHAHQLFVSTLDGKQRMQVTHHEEVIEFPLTSAGVSDYSWSPDSRKIGVNVYENHKRVTEIIDVEAKNNEAPILLPASVLLWWIDASHMVIWSGTGRDEGIYVYSLDTQRFHQVALQNEYPTWIYGIHPFVKPEWIGVYTGDDVLYVFDSVTNSIIFRQPISTADLTGWWTTTPKDFPGYSACQAR